MILGIVMMSVMVVVRGVVTISVIVPVDTRGNEMTSPHVLAVVRIIVSDLTFVEIFGVVITSCQLLTACREIVADFDFCLWIVSKPSFVVISWVLFVFDSSRLNTSCLPAWLLNWKTSTIL